MHNLLCFLNKRLPFEWKLDSTRAILRTSKCKIAISISSLYHCTNILNQNCCIIHLHPLFVVWLYPQYRVLRNMAGGYVTTGDWLYRWFDKSFHCGWIDLSLVLDFSNRRGLLPCFISWTGVKMALENLTEEVVTATLDIGETQYTAEESSDFIDGIDLDFLFCFSRGAMFLGSKL